MSSSAVRKGDVARPGQVTSKAIAVVGADGFVGSSLASSLGAKRIVYGACGDGEVHVTQAKQALREADVVINAGGFRVRPGCTYEDYQRVHQGATAAIVPWIRPGATLLHVSSGSILGSSKDRKLSARMMPHPETFPAPAYAMAKYEADQFVADAAARQGFRVIYLMPAVVYAENGSGMVQTMIGLAKKGTALRVYPRDARHHLCHANLLAEVFTRVIELGDSLPDRSRFLAADPYTVTNRELEELIHRYAGRKLRTMPLPVGLLAAIFTRTFHSKIPKLDLKTWGEIFGVLNYDTEYDATETFQVLGIDPSRFSMGKTLEPLIRGALQS
jgi:nucleoside-diphosphate-sugar epimerase